MMWWILFIAAIWYAVYLLDAKGCAGNCKQGREKCDCKL